MINPAILAQEDIVAGLALAEYSGYFADSPTWFDARTPLSTPSVVTSVSQSIAEGRSLQALGYFVPTVTGPWTWYSVSDDASWLWLGPTALAGYTTGNAVINNSGLHAEKEIAYTATFTAGVLYPFRWQAGNQPPTGSGNPGAGRLFVRGPDGVKTSEFGPQCQTNGRNTTARYGFV